MPFRRVFRRQAKRVELQSPRKLNSALLQDFLLLISTLLTDAVNIILNDSSLENRLAADSDSGEEFDTRVKSSFNPSDATDSDEQQSPEPKRRRVNAGSQRAPGVFDCLLLFSRSLYYRMIDSVTLCLTVCQNIAHQL